MSEEISFEPGVWFIRICAPISILLQLKILKSELDKRKTDKWSDLNSQIQAENEKNKDEE